MRLSLNNIQQLLRNGKQFILKRYNIIKKNGFASKQRVAIDEKINKCLKESEANLEILKMILKDFTAENFELIDKEEFGMRASKIELLQENLKILKDEYWYNPNVEAKALLNHNDTFGDEEGVVRGENGGNRRNGDIFPDRNAPIYVAFDKNDVQINQISGNITHNVAVLKEKMENVHLGALQQSETLARLSKRNFQNYKIIRDKDNSLKEKLYKIRHGRKAIVDLCLIIFLLCLISVIVSIATD